MNIGASLKARLDEAFLSAREHIIIHRDLVNRRARARTRGEEEQLSVEILRVRADWQRQIDKCNALRRLLADYTVDGWEAGPEIKLR